MHLFFWIVERLILAFFVFPIELYDLNHFNVGLNSIIEKMSLTWAKKSNKTKVYMEAVYSNKEMGRLFQHYKLLLILILIV